MVLGEVGGFDVRFAKGATVKEGFAMVVFEGALKKFSPDDTETKRRGLSITVDRTFVVNI